MSLSVYKKMRFLWLSFHLSQCTATSPVLASVNGCKEIEGVKWKKNEKEKSRKIIQKVKEVGQDGRQGGGGVDGYKEGGREAAEG